MTNPTPKQLAMARRIAETLIPDGLDPNLSLRVGIRGIAEQAALAAIIETTEAAAGLVEENARLRGALRDASVSLWWAARQMKGNCNGGAVDAVNLAAEDASSVAALTGRQG